jgi:hypothetical protein
MNEYLYVFMDSIKFFGIDVFDSESFFNLTVRFFFNFFITFILARVLYYSVSKRKDYLFTYLLISTIVFLLCFMLGSVKLQIGFALGLFAIFGILRYRTDAIPIKEMTYLFIIIGVSVINALFNKKVSWSEVVFTNLIVVFFTFVLEKVWLLKHESSKLVLLEKIELIKPEKHKELIEDLKQRTGLPVHRIEIGKIDFLRDVAQVTVFFYESKFTGNQNVKEQQLSKKLQNEDED